LCVDRCGLSHLAYAVSLREDDAAILDDGDGEARHLPISHGLAGVCVEVAKWVGRRACLSEDSAEGVEEEEQAED
jgi:hypothetical protein